MHNGFRYNVPFTEAIALSQKAAQFGFYYGGGVDNQEEPAEPALDNMDRVELFNGTHPAVMQQRIQAYSYQYIFNKKRRCGG